MKNPAATALAAPKITDDQIRESLEGAQLKAQRERGHDQLLLTVDDPDLEEKLLVVMDTLQKESEAIRDGIGKTVALRTVAAEKPGSMFVSVNSSAPSITGLLFSIAKALGVDNSGSIQFQFHKIVEKLENGSLDIGVLSLPVQSPSLKVQAIYRDRLMLMVSPKNPLAKMKAAHVSEVVKYPLLLPKTGHTRRLLDKLFREYNTELKVRMELPSIGMIKSFVAADLGISLISGSFARDEVAAGRVKLVELEGAELWRELGVAYRRDRTLSVATKTFLSVVRQLSVYLKKEGSHS